MINKNQEYKLTDEILCQVIDGETVILDLKSENYFGLNEVGSQAIELLQTGTTLTQLVEQLENIYAVEKIELEKDMTELLLQLLQEKLITPTA